MKRVSALGCSAVSIALVLSMWGLAPTAQAGTVAAPVAASATAPVAQAPAARQDAAKKGKRWKAYSGAYFNNPHIPSQRYRIERRLMDTLRHVPKGETVRIALYSFDRIPVANQIVAARKRGVNIQMLLNDHWENRAMQIVRGALGTNRSAKNFIYKCKSGCRTQVDQYRNLHSKFYLFPKAGKSKKVIAIGSHNLTLNADRHQWNDMYFFEAEDTLYKQFVSTFKDMKKDYSKTQPAMHYCGVPANGQFCDDSVDKYTNWVFPKKSTKQADLVLNMLDKIQCLTPDGAGGQVATKLALSMHTMRGQRGNYLASAIRQKWAEGCDFRVSYGLIGYKTKQILGASTARGRIPLRSTGLDYDPTDDFDLNNDGDDDVILTYYTHQKYFVVQGTYNGVPEHQHGAHRLLQLGLARHRAGRGVLHHPGRRQRQALPQELQLVLGQRPVLAQRLHHDVHQLPGAGADAARRRHRADDVQDRAPARHHRRARPVQAGRPELGRRLIAAAPAGAIDGGRAATGAARGTSAGPTERVETLRSRAGTEPPRFRDGCCATSSTSGGASAISRPRTPLPPSSAVSSCSASATAVSWSTACTSALVLAMLVAIAARLSPV